MRRQKPSLCVWAIIAGRYTYEGIRHGKAYSKIKFTVEKADGRQVRETQLGKKAKVHARRQKAIVRIGDPENPPSPSNNAIDAFRQKWPGNDPYEAIGRFQML